MDIYIKFKINSNIKSNINNIFLFYFQLSIILLIIDINVNKPLFYQLIINIINHQFNNIAPTLYQHTNKHQHIHTP